MASGTYLATRLIGAMIVLGGLEVAVRAEIALTFSEMAVHRRKAKWLCRCLAEAFRVV